MTFMKKIKKVRKRNLLGLVLLGGALFYLFWGPLFPWSPYKPGYIKIEAKKGNVYITDPEERDSVVFKVDEIVQLAEEFHDLEFRSNFRIMVLPIDADMKRYLPWLKGSGYSVSLSMADLIYIGPTARKSAWGIGTYIKHELSHMLIDQNTTTENALIIHEQGWLAEGIAEYFSGHRFYTREEMREGVLDGNIEFNGVLEKNPLNMSMYELKIRYSYYAYFIEFVVDKYGKNKFQQYLKTYIADPESYKKSIDDVYSSGLDVLLAEYRAYILG